MYQYSVPKFSIILRHSNYSGRAQIHYAISRTNLGSCKNVFSADDLVPVVLAHPDTAQVTPCMKLRLRTSAVSRTASQNKAFDLVCYFTKLLIRSKVRIEMVPM